MSNLAALDKPSCVATATWSEAPSALRGLAPGGHLQHLLFPVGQGPPTPEEQEELLWYYPSSLLLLYALEKSVTRLALSPYHCSSDCSL